MTDLEKRVEDLEKEIRSISATRNRDIPLKARRLEYDCGGCEYYCPVCNEKLLYENNKIARYCHNCGQKIEGDKAIWER